MSKAQKGNFDANFHQLALEVTSAIARNKDETTQQQQVEELLEAEKKFKEAISKYRQSTEVYKKFLQKIRIQNRNILSARPYFRESAVSFSKRVTPAIKDENIELLKTFDINYQLITFIKKAWLGPFPKKAEQLFQRVHKARTILIENNMPLAINRAKLFFRKTPKSHLSMMDMIGICGMGLASGIDKFVGKYTTVFRSVLICRMVGNLIDSYSEKVLYFFPTDKRILYKANVIKGRQGIEDIHELTEAVNKSFKEDEKNGIVIPNEVSVSELAYLLSASSMLSADSTVNDEGYGVYSYTPDENQNTEEAYIQRESTIQMLILAQKLPLLHRKVLRLKGVKI